MCCARHRTILLFDLNEVGVIATSHVKHPHGFISHNQTLAVEAL